MNLVNKMTDEAAMLEHSNPELSKKLNQVKGDLSKEVMDKFIDSDAFLFAANILSESIRSGNSDRIPNIDSHFQLGPNLGAIVDVFEENGITEFTLSAKDIDIYETCSKFIDAGCQIAGTKEVYLNHRGFGEKQNDRGLAFVFMIMFKTIEE